MNRHVATFGLTLLVAIAVQPHSPVAANDADPDAAAAELPGLRTSAHRVTVRQVGRFVEFSVQRRISNPTAAALAVEVTWPLPQNGAVTQLRWRRDDDATWIDGELLPVQEAAEIYQRYQNGETPQPRGPVLATSDGPSLTLQSPTLARGRVLLIEYQVTAALCYANGSYIAAYPAPAAQPDPPQLQTTSRAFTTTHLAAPLHSCEVQGNEIEQWRYTVFPNQLKVGVLTQLHRVDAMAGGVSEFIVEIGQQLEAAPRQANVVFVIDASRSVDNGTVDDQLKIAADFLHQLPDASFNIIFARRKAMPLWGRMQPARMAAKLANLPAVVTDRSNGSNFDEALQMAASMLGNLPGPHYLIAFTDAQWRKSLRAEDLPARLIGLPATAVLHLVTVPRAVVPQRAGGHTSDDSVGQAWDFNPTCDPLAAAFGHRWRGMVVMLENARCSGSSDDLDRHTQPPLSAQLVRPMLIEKLTLDGEPFADQVIEGNVVNVLHATPGSRLRTISGSIWGRPWNQTRMDDPVASRLFAATAHTTELREQMSPVVAEQVAMVGHAISPFTSMLAIDHRFGPGAIEAGDLLGISGMSSSFDSCCSDIGHLVGFATSKGVEPTLQSQLQGVAASCATQQHLATWQATVKLELTGLEIVAVTTTTQDGPAFQTCVTEGIWSVSAVNPKDLAEVTVELQNQP